MLFSTRLNKIFMLIIAATTVLMILVAYGDAQNMRRMIYRDRERMLVETAGQFGFILSRPFDDVVRENGLENGSREEKVAVLHRYAQPIVENFAAGHPGLGIGVYARDPDSYIAFTTMNDPSLFHGLRYPESYTLYETGSLVVLYGKLSSYAGGQPVLSVHYPLFNNGRIVGHVVASSKIADINRTFRETFGKRFVFIFLVWLALLFFIWYNFHRMHHALADLARQIGDKDDNPQRFTEFPELLPILNTTIKLREKLKKESNMVRWMLERIPGGIVAIDCERRITFANAAACRLLTGKKDCGDLTGQDIEPLVGRDKNVPLEDVPFIRPLINGEVLCRYKKFMYGRMYQVDAAPVVDPESGMMLGSAAYFWDISEEEKLRAEMDRMDRLDTVGQLAASVAHEVRNPLTVVRGYVQYLMRQTGGRFDDQFRLIISEVDRAHSIIQEFLSLARDRVIEKQMMNLNDIVADLAPLIATDAVKQGVQMELRYGENLPLLLLNASEVKQLILNLARNAMDAMAGSGRMLLATAAEEGRVGLIVVDSGRGIAAQSMDMIFDPFFTTKQRGTGLGLSVCKRIAERHNAKIEITSTLGEGTRFTVWFRTDTNQREKDRFQI